MKTYSVKPIKMTDGEVATENALVLIRQYGGPNTPQFAIFDDHYGEFRSGETPIASDLNPTFGFDSLDDVKKVLVENGVILENAEFKEETL